MDQKQQDHELYHQLSFYTLCHSDPAFIHQYIVDAYAAQYADETTKPITLAFALIGLYLHLERNYTGKQVQQAHMQLAEKRKQWPLFVLPAHRGDITVTDVMDTTEGQERDAFIDKWCASVWAAYGDSHNAIKEIVIMELD